MRAALAEPNRVPAQLMDALRSESPKSRTGHHYGSFYGQTNNYYYIPGRVTCD